MRLDLDKARAARAEAAKEAPVITFGGRDFELPVEPGASLLEALSEFYAIQRASEALKEGEEDDTGPAALDAIWRAAEALLGERWGEFKELDPSIHDVMELVAGFPELYSFDGLGESLASGGSSTTTSRPSKPTSNGSTKRTSSRPSGAKKGSG